MADNRMLLPHLLDAGTHSPKEVVQSSPSNNWDSTGHTPATGVPPQEQMYTSNVPQRLNVTAKYNSGPLLCTQFCSTALDLSPSLLHALFKLRKRSQCNPSFPTFRGWRFLPQSCSSKRPIVMMISGLAVCLLLYILCRGPAAENDIPISSLLSRFQAGTAAESAACQRPLVGVLTLPCGKLCPAGGGGYIAASYVKWLEAAGAQVVPIPHYGSRDEVSTLLGMVSGVLFTGGGGQGLLWDNLTKWIIEARQTAELQGLPVFGTCLGFERIMQVAAKNDSILEQTPGADDVSLTLRWTKHEDSVMESDHYFSEVKKATEARNMTYNHHDWGVWLDQLHMYPEAMVDLRVLATSRSFGSERDFVAVVEGRNALDGVWAVQFHPEKPSFEWNSKLSIDHSRISVAANRFFGDFFLDGVRTHIPRDGCSTVSEEAPALIYNYPLVFTGWRNSTGKPREGYFTETYFV